MSATLYLLVESRVHTGQGLACDSLLSRSVAGVGQILELVGSGGILVFDTLSNRALRGVSTDVIYSLTEEL